MAENKNYYKILGVNKNASKKEIKTAYRNLAKKHHPDVSNDINAKNKFIQISEAYAILSDDNKKKQYDMQGYGAFKDLSREDIFKNVDLNDVLRGINIAGNVFDLIFGNSHRKSDSILNIVDSALNSTSHKSLHSKGSKSKKHQHGKPKNIKMTTTKSRVHGKKISSSKKKHQHGKKSKTLKKTKTTHGKAKSKSKHSSKTKSNSKKSTGKKHMHGKKRNLKSKRSLKSKTGSSTTKTILSGAESILSNSSSHSVNRGGGRGGQGFGRGGGHGFGRGGGRGSGMSNLGLESLVVESLVRYLLK